jgi:hypothetical protein
MMATFVFDTSELTEALFRARLDNMLARRDHLENFVRSTEPNPRQFPDIGFFPIILVYLRIKAQRVRLHSRQQGRAVSLAELDLTAMAESSLVRKFQGIRLVLWVWAVVALLVDL